ncbi:MAG: aconitase X catalytic domain-containing protein [Gammaproteobacteria bacterium]|nr:aconitase X catalytic domain-containing protein [Gammaproteobacteria bacterium]
MKLNQLDQERLDGKLGKAMQFAMQTIVTAAHIDQVDSLIDISFAHIDACFYNGRAHLDFVNYMLEHGATLAVPSWTNNGLVALNDLSLRDPHASREMDEARQLMQAYVRLGCNPVWTCAPYQLPDRPKLGAHIVGSESNAVSFYNSVIGARSNKYGDYLDVCAAIIGRVPFSKLHRDEARAAELVFDVSKLPQSVLDNDLFYHLLGHVIGRRSGHRIPAVTGLAASCNEDDLKAISAAGSSSGSVPLFHAVGITPEAATLEIACQGAAVEQVIELEITDLQQARRELGVNSERPLAGIALGTPHFSFSEFERLVDLLGERRVQAGLVCYLTTSRHVYAQAAERGWTDALEVAGMKIITDTCTYFSPAINGLEGKIMTNSAKWAYYAPGMLPVEAVIGSLAECVESAVSGEVRLDQWALS